MPDAGMAVRRAIAIPCGGIAAVGGIYDRALKRLEASLARTAERHRHHSEAASHPIRNIRAELLFHTTMSGITIG